MPGYSFEIVKDRKGEFRVRFKARNGETMFQSEGYTAKASALNAIKSILKNGASAAIVDATKIAKDAPAKGGKAKGGKVKAKAAKAKVGKAAKKPAAAAKPAKPMKADKPKRKVARKPKAAPAPEPAPAPASEAPTS